MKERGLDICSLRGNRPSLKIARIPIYGVRPRFLTTSKINLEEPGTSGREAEPGMKRDYLLTTGRQLRGGGEGG
jgi:hypothetical protein